MTLHVLQEVDVPHLHMFATNAVLQSGRLLGRSITRHWAMRRGSLYRARNARLYGDFNRLLEFVVLARHGSVSKIREGVVDML